MASEREDGLAVLRVTTEEARVVPGGCQAGKQRAVLVKALRECADGGGAVAATGGGVGGEMTREELVEECQRLARASLEENYWASRVLQSLALSLFTETEEIMATELERYTNAQMHAMKATRCR